MKHTIILLLLYSVASAQTLCPDGTYVGGECTLAPDGSYVGTDEPRFDSAGAGFARGFDRGLLIRAQKDPDDPQVKARRSCEAELLPEIIHEARQAPLMESAEANSALTNIFIENYLASLELCVLDKTLTDAEFLEVIKLAFPSE